MSVNYPPSPGTTGSFDCPPSHQYHGAVGYPPSPGATGSVDTPSLESMESVVCPLFRSYIQSTLQSACCRHCKANEIPVVLTLLWSTHKAHQHMQQQPCNICRRATALQINCCPLWKVPSRPFFLLLFSPANLQSFIKWNRVSSLTTHNGAVLGASPRPLFPNGWQPRTVPEIALLPSSASSSESR